MRPDVDTNADAGSLARLPWRGTRRRVLLASLGGAAGALLAACGGSGGAKPTATSIGAAPLPTSSPAASANPTTSVASPATTSPSVGAQTIGKLTVRAEQRPTYAGAPIDGDELRVTRFEDLSNLSPTALAAYSPFTFIYDPLIWIDEVTLDPAPRLASKWEVSADGLRYTFQLRDDVRFHDDTPLTADDVVFSLTAYRDDRDSGVKDFFAEMSAAPRAIDTHTVGVTLSAPSAGFLANACNQFILQRQQFADYWATNSSLSGFDAAATPLIGSGPWRMASVNVDDGQLNLTRHDAYWLDPPHFQRLTFRSIDAAANRIELWNAGGTDLLWPVSPTDLPHVQDSADAWLYAANTVAYMCAWFNFANPSQPVADLFKPKEVRQALMHAIDRDGYAAAIFKGFIDQTAYGVVPQAWAYTADVPRYAYDPEQALALLQAQGWTKQGEQLVNAAGQPLALTAIVSDLPQYPVDKLATWIKNNFQQLGIALTIEPLGASDYADAFRTTRQFDLAFSSRILFAGFNEYSFLEAASDTASNPDGNNSGWRNADAERLLTAIHQAPDQAAQVAPLRDLQRVLADDLPALWLGFPRDLILARKNILGFQPNPMWQYWNTAGLWRSVSYGRMAYAPTRRSVAASPPVSVAQ